MAKIPTLTRRITPSGRVAGVPIPSDIADVGQGIETQGLAVLGRGITDIGNLLFELSERERKADDLLASDSAGIARQSAADSYLQFKEDNKDPKLWSEAAKRFRNDADSAFEKIQFFDPQRKERETLRHVAEMNHFEAIAQLQVTDAKSKIAVTATTDSFVSAFANNSSDLAAKEADLDEALLNEFGEELAVVRKREILRVAQKAFYIDQSKLVPDDIITEMKKKKKALGRGGKDKQGLGAKDYDDITASAYTAKALTSQTLNIQQEIDRDKLGQALHDGMIDYTMINSTSLSEKEQESFRVKMNAEAERKAKGIVIETNETVKGELESMAYDISTGAVTVPEFRNRLTEERYTNKTIDDDVYDELFSLAERKFESYQAGAMKEREVFALGQLVTLPGELGYLEQLRQLTTQFEKDQLTSLRQLQFDNHDQYKKALRDWLKLPKNKDANADEIYIEGRKLLTHYRKTPDQLRKEAEPPELEITPLTQEQKEKMARGIQEALIKGLTGQPKAKMSISDVPEPKTKREMINKLRDLQKSNPDLVTEYYNKYLDKFW